MRSPAPTTWNAEITAYCRHLSRDARRSAGTVTLRRHHLARLSRTLVGQHPYTVTSAQLLEWLGEQRWKPETHKSARSSLRGFYAWAVAHGRLKASPAASLPPVVVPRALPRPMPDALAAAAMAGADPRGRLMIALAAFCGLRCAELARVHSDDLLGDQLLVHGKGGHQRLVPVLNTELRAAICGAGGFLFPGQIDGHLSPRYVSLLFSRMLPGQWTGHTLRHRAATVAYAGTSDLRAVQELLGHASVRTTERYVAVSGMALARAAAAANGLSA